MIKHINLSLYWKCQLIGWSVASLYWSFLGYSGGGFNIGIGLLQLITDVAAYVLISDLYRNFAIRHQWQQLNLDRLILRMVPAVIILGAAYLNVTVIKTYLFQLWLSPATTPTLAFFLKGNWMAMFMAGLRLMAIWLLAYHLYHYARREISIAKENARLTIVAKDAQLNSLSTQLNPHFLFNSLNNIKALVIENPGSARRAIDLLSDLLRTSLYNSDIVFTTVRDELALVSDYFELEKMRLEERLQFQITTDDQLDDLLIPRFCIQTLAENAVKHGIANQKNGGLIIVKIISVTHGISISIQNPGNLTGNISSNGLGIKNLNERLELEYKGMAKFKIMNDGIGNVLTTLIIPRP